MRGTLFIIIIALLSPVIVRHVQGAGGYVVVKNCTDRALCFSGCTSYTLQTDQCLPTNEGSQVITCPPAMSVCGDLAYFTDSACENLLMMDAFLCDQCNQNNAGEFTTAVCSREGIFEFLELASCTSQCGSCSVGGNMTRDTCIPFGQQQVEWAVRRNPA
ncbi:cysteine proteinase-like, putative, partial [Bodo saltans]